MQLVLRLSLKRLKTSPIAKFNIVKIGLRSIRFVGEVAKVALRNANKDEIVGDAVKQEIFGFSIFYAQVMSAYMKNISYHRLPLPTNNWMIQRTFSHL